MGHLYSIYAITATHFKEIQQKHAKVQSFAMPSPDHKVRRSCHSLNKEPQQKHTYIYWLVVSTPLKKY